jgi:hypothetical protein
MPPRFSGTPGPLVADLVRALQVLPDSYALAVGLDLVLVAAQPGAVAIVAIGGPPPDDGAIAARRIEAAAQAEAILGRTGAEVGAVMTLAALVDAEAPVGFTPGNGGIVHGNELAALPVLVDRILSQAKGAPLPAATLAALAPAAMAAMMPAARKPVFGGALLGDVADFMAAEGVETPPSPGTTDILQALARPATPRNVRHRRTLRINRNPALVAARAAVERLLGRVYRDPAKARAAVERALAAGRITADNAPVRLLMSPLVFGATVERPTVPAAEELTLALETLASTLEQATRAASAAVSLDTGKGGRR